MQPTNSYEVQLSGYEFLMDECEVAMELAELERLGLVETITLPNGELAFSITQEGIAAADATQE